MGFYLDAKTQRRKDLFFPKKELCASARIGRNTPLERFDFDVTELDVLPGPLEPDRARLELGVVIIEHFFAVEHDDEVVALRRHVEMMPFAHHDGRLVLALQVT